MRFARIPSNPLGAPVGQVIPAMDSAVCEPVTISVFTDTAPSFPTLSASVISDGLDMIAALIVDVTIIPRVLLAQACATIVKITLVASTVTCASLDRTATRPTQLAANSATATDMATSRAAFAIQLLVYVTVWTTPKVATVNDAFLDFMVIRDTVATA